MMPAFVQQRHGVLPTSCLAFPSILNLPTPCLLPLSTMRYQTPEVVSRTDGSPQRLRLTGMAERSRWQRMLLAPAAPDGLMP